MLALMCILYRGEGSLPRNRSEVYEQCANLLFRKWDARRRIHLDLRAGHLLEPALRHLAWWLFTHDQAHVAVTERELVGETAAFLHGRGFEAEDDAREAATEFVEFCKGRMWVFSDVGTTATGEALYSFTHRTFLEYFAAAQLAYKCDTPERLARSIAPHIARNEWEVVGELAVQIKDHTSDRGAQRVYIALINERRRRSASGRSGVLQFLARCLRSVDPSPQVVRHLSRQVLDHLFTGNLDHKVRYLPLSWLAASCTNCKEIVYDEVHRRIDQLIECDDRDSCLNGFRLALWLHSSITLRRENDPRLNNESPLAKFWEQHLADAVRAHLTTLVSLAEVDTGVRYGAQRQGIISMNQALEMTGGLFPFFQIQPTGMFDITWAPQLESSLLSLMSGEEDAEEIDALVAVAQYLTRNPNPPWITGAPYPLSGFSSEWIENLNVSPLPELEPMAYLGAAAVLLMALECDKDPQLVDSMTHRFGPLYDLHPYVARRWRINLDQNLPDLRIPFGFRKLFVDWAENKVNFVDQPTQSQRDAE